MQISCSVSINAASEAVWAKIADIPNAAEHISGITNIEVLEESKGPSIVGLKWKETRIMYGKEASEVMWITEAIENSYYDTRAESHGVIYTSRMSVEPEGDGTKLTFDFGGEPVSFGAKVMGLLMGWMMKGSVRKALLEDLEDIKKAVEV